MARQRKAQAKVVTAATPRRNRGVVVGQPDPGGRPLIGHMVAVRLGEHPHTKLVAMAEVNGLSQAQIIRLLIERSPIRLDQ